jgi:hypothetical protein
MLSQDVHRQGTGNALIQLAAPPIAETIAETLAMLYWHRYVPTPPCPELVRGSDPVAICFWDFRWPKKMLMVLHIALNTLVAPSFLKSKAHPRQRFRIPQSNSTRDGDICPVLAALTTQKTATKMASLTKKTVR